MLINDELMNDVKIKTLSFSYTDEIDESYEDAGEEDDFESSSDSSLNKFDDDIYDETLDDDDVNVNYDSDDSEYPADELIDESSAVLDDSDD